MSFEAFKMLRCPHCRADFTSELGLKYHVGNMVCRKAERKALRQSAAEGDQHAVDAAARVAQAEIDKACGHGAMWSRKQNHKHYKRARDKRAAAWDALRSELPPARPKVTEAETLLEAVDYIKRLDMQAAGLMAIKAGLEAARAAVL